MKTAPRLLGALAAVGALVVTGSGAAVAATTTIDDGADATASLHDVLTTTIKHRSERVVVRTTYTDLRRHSDAGPAGTTIHLDTVPERKGPEFALTTGLQDGTDYQLVKVRRWKLTTTQVDCAHDLRIRWKRDVTRLRVDRACIGDPEQVRVSQKMVDQYDGSHPVIDWAPGRKRFSAWVSAG